MSEIYGSNKVFKQEIITMLQTAGYDVTSNTEYETLFGTYKKADAQILVPQGSPHPIRLAIFARYQHVTGSMLEKMPFLVDSSINATNEGVFDAVIIIVDGEPLEALEDYYQQKMDECSSLFIVNTKKFRELLERDFLAIKVWRHAR